MCSSRLAFDQRYCLECGTRRGPLPLQMAEVVNSILERGHEVAVIPGQKAGVPVAGARRARRIDLWSPSPQAAAVAVMGMLGMGVIIGDVSGANILTLASSPGISINLPPGWGQPSSNGGVVNQSPTTSAAAPVTGSAPVVTTAAPAPATATPTTPVTTTPTSTGGSGGAVPGPLVLPPVKHVFLIVLSNEGYAQTFSPVSHDTYLNKTLPAKGGMIQNYYAVAGSSLANEIAMVSGQGPTQQTEVNCPSYTKIKPFKKGTDGQIVGSGCVYPRKTKTLAAQLAAHHDSWKAYIDGLQKGPRSQRERCGVPRLGQPDPYYAPRRKDTYVSWHNPFVYFSALTGRSRCHSFDVPMGQLSKDLKRSSSTPSFSYIAPSACEDGDPTPCKRHAQAGLVPADRFLKRTLRLIEASPAYKASGLIIITFDHAQQSGPHADQSACCSTPTYPNLPAGTGTTPTAPYAPPTGSTGTTGATGSTSSTGIGATGSTGSTSTTGATGTTGANLGGGQTTPTGGGGQVGLLLISKWVKPGSQDVIDFYNHFSLLQGIEALFSQRKYIGFAGDVALPRFTPTLFNYHQP